MTSKKEAEVAAMRQLKLEKAEKEVKKLEGLLSQDTSKKKANFKKRAATFKRKGDEAQSKAWAAFRRAGERVNGPDFDAKTYAENAYEQVKLKRAKLPLKSSRFFFNDDYAAFLN